MDAMDIRRIRTSIEAELSNAQASRMKANEGRARVCARRAAGLAVSIYFEQETTEQPPQSAYRLLQWFSLREEVPEDLRLAAKRLTVRVTPAYELPHKEDPIDDARKIISAILNGVI
jgi:hypothetical protein